MRFPGQRAPLIRATLLVLAVIWLAPPLLAQQGLPGGPDLSNSLQTLEKTVTRCTKCKDEEAAYHKQVDVYDQAKATYAAQLLAVRKAADAFLMARQVYDRDFGAFDTLSKRADGLLFGTEDRSLYDYDQTRDDRDAAEPAARAAEAGLAQARNDLSIALKALESLRTKALSEMRSAIRLQLAMYRCELTCDVSELDLGDELRIGDPPKTESVSPGLPPLIAASEVPKPENFLGIVAKCAACQALAEKVNTLRSHRRSFASSAEMLHQSLTANHKTLEKLLRQAELLKQQEKQLYQQLLAGFTARAPSEYADELDQTFDRRDQQEAETALRHLTEQRAEVARDAAGLSEVIAQQTKGLLAAILNYRLHTALLEAAQAELAACEKTCKPAEPPKTAIDPFVDPAYPQQENVDFVLAKCPTCQPIADDLMQTLSKRRSVAGDIQTEVWLLKSRRKALKEWSAQDDELAKEERLLGAFLVGDTGLQNEGQVLDRLFEIEELRTKLISDLLWAEDEITRLDAQLAANMKEHARLTKRGAELRKALADCEAKCLAEKDKPKVSLPGSDYDRAYPVPESFVGRLADCPTCQPLAEALNDLMKQRYVVASDLQSTLARLKFNSSLLAKRQAELAKLLAREQDLAPIWTRFDDSPEQQAAGRELDQIDLARRQAEADIAGLKKLNAEDEEVIDALEQQHEELEGKIAKAEVALQDCEADRCADPNGGLIGIGQNGAPQSPFVSTDCEPCQQIASMINDAVGTLIGAERELKAAKDKLAQIKEEAQTRADRLRSVLARESQLNEAWLATQDEAKRAEIDQELHGIDKQRNALTDAQAKEGAAVKAAETAIAEAQGRVDDLKALIAKLKTDLTRCENQCKPTKPGGLIGIGQNGIGQNGIGQNGAPQSPFVSTDCEPCQQIASMINDAVGTLIGAERELKAAKDKLAQIKEEAQTRADRLRSVLARESQLNEAWLTTQDEAKRAEIDQELHGIDTQRNDLTDAQAKEGAAVKAAEAAIAEAQKRVDDLKALIAKLKADLATCENQCKPAKPGGLIGIGQNGAPQSPFVSTDCEPCQQIASMINDAVGTLIGAERELKAAKDKLAQIKEEAQTRADRLRSVLARESQLNEAWLTTQDEAKRAEIDQELHGIDTQRNALTDAQAKEGAAVKAAEAAIAEAQKRVDDLKALIAKLKADLARCENQCKPAKPGGQNGTGQNGIGQNGIGQNGAPQSPFVSTNCEPCQQIVSELRDVIGSIPAAQTQADQDKAALEALRAQRQASAEAMEAAQEAFSQAIYAKARLSKQGKDVSAQNDTIKRELDKASDFLTEVEDLGLEIIDAEAAWATSSAYLKQLKAREAALRKKLADCEFEKCKIKPKPAAALPGTPAKPQDPLKVLLDKLQQGSCKGGADCDFEIKVANPSNQDWLGPLFLTESQAVGTKHPDWHCSPAGKGQSLCFTQQGPRAGQTLSFTVHMPLAKGAKLGAENCIALKIGSDGKVMIQMLQAGLAAKGFTPGPADGLPGRNTKRALAAFAEASGQDLTLDRPAEVYRALFGAAPGSPMTGATPMSCSAITLSDDPNDPLQGLRPKIKLDIDLEELLRRQQEGQELTPEQQEALEMQQQEKNALEDELLKKKKKLTVPLPALLAPLF